MFLNAQERSLFATTNRDKANNLGTPKTLLAVFLVRLGLVTTPTRLELEAALKGKLPPAPALYYRRMLCVRRASTKGGAMVQLPKGVEDEKCQVFARTDIGPELAKCVLDTVLEPGRWLVDTVLNALVAVLWESGEDTPIGFLGIDDVLLLTRPFKAQHDSDTVRGVRLSAAALRYTVLLGVLLFDRHYVSFAFDVRSRKTLTCNSLGWTPAHREALLVASSNFTPRTARGSPSAASASWNSPCRGSSLETLWLGGLVPFPLDSTMVARVCEILAATLIARGIPGLHLG